MDLVIEEILGQVKSESENREELLSEIDNSMAAQRPWSVLVCWISGVPRLLVAHQSISETGQLGAVGPDVLSCHHTIIGARIARSVFPTNVEALVEIASILWVRILSE